jgi:hypothetical protein
MTTRSTKLNTNHSPKNNFNYDMCKACGGDCCTNMSGSYTPKNFDQKITFEFIAKLLKDGKTSIDWYEAAPDIYYLRPRHVNAPIVDPSWGGVCTYHSKESGCSLSEKDRPFQCIDLVPNKPHSCNSSEQGGKLKCAEAWLEHQPILEKLYYQYEYE